MKTKLGWATAADPAAPPLLASIAPRPITAAATPAMASALTGPMLALAGSLTAGDRVAALPFLTPSSPPFELEEWKAKPHLARLKPLVQDWGLNGFGSPGFVYLVYGFKL